MGKLEQEAKRRRRKGLIQHAILSSIAIGGILLVAATAPNALQLMGGFGRNKYRYANQAKTSLARLAQKGLVVFEEKGGKRYARITEAGRQALMRDLYKFDIYKDRRKWDGRWRLVMFDIPERRRKTRDALRSTMHSYGFYRLQDSAWIYPHDCEDLISLLKSDLRIGSAVLYLIVEKMEDDTRIKEHFTLK